MEQYKDLSGHSGIEAYEIGADFIRVKFINNSIYLYTNTSSGAANISWMKKLAQRGYGLSTFISQHIKGNYAQKEQ